MSDEPLTEEQLQAIEARAAAATSPPWHLEEVDEDLVEIHADDYTDALNPEGCQNTFGTLSAGANAEFIRHARQDVPRLLADVRRLRRERDDAYRGLNDWKQTAVVAHELAERMQKDRKRMLTGMAELVRMIRELSQAVAPSAPAEIKAQLEAQDRDMAAALAALEKEL